jgi:hypothetical protein
MQNTYVHNIKICSVKEIALLQVEESACLLELYLPSGLSGEFHFGHSFGFRFYE